MRCCSVFSVAHLLRTPCFQIALWLVRPVPLVAGLPVASLAPRLHTRTPLYVQHDAMLDIVLCSRWCYLPMTLRCASCALLVHVVVSNCCYIAVCIFFVNYDGVVLLMFYQMGLISTFAFGYDCLVLLCA